MWLAPLWDRSGSSVIGDSCIVKMELLITAATLKVGCQNCCGRAGIGQYAGIKYHGGASNFWDYKLVLSGVDDMPMYLAVGPLYGAMVRS